jgi:hypothetical protein
MIAIETDTQATLSDDTNDVVICAAPVSGKRREVVAIRFSNEDNVAHTAILKKKIVSTVVWSERVVGVPGSDTSKGSEKGWCSREQPFHLKPTETLVGALGEAATTECFWLVEFLETTD